MKTAPQIILASASPRRGALLTQIGIRYLQQPAGVDEKIGEEESPADAVVRLSDEKAKSIWLDGAAAGVPVLGADTIVVHEGDILQKPGSREEGIEMIARLSGTTHQVMSAVSVVDGSGVRNALSTSRVTFRKISSRECDSYWNSGEPTDKAGGYAIQGLGAILIAHLEGSYSGVMGLPLFETAQLLGEVGVGLL